MSGVKNTISKFLEILKTKFFKIDTKKTRQT